MTLLFVRWKKYKASDLFISSMMPIYLACKITKSLQYQGLIDPSQFPKEKKGLNEKKKFSLSEKEESNFRVNAFDGDEIFTSFS